MNEESGIFLISGGLLTAFLACAALYAFCIIEIHRHKTRYAGKKAMWLNIIWLAPLIGCIIYLMNRRRIWKQPNSSF